MNKSILTSLVLCVSSAFSLAGETEDFFIKISKGEFTPPKNPALPSSGWVMGSYTRAKLNRQVGVIVKHGILAVPECIERLRDKEMHIRYIAAESLRRITKKKPIWYSFGTPGKRFNGNETWSNDAIRIWKQWYKNQQRDKAQ